MSDIAAELARVRSAYEQPTLTLLGKDTAPVVLAVFRSLFTTERPRIATSALHDAVDDLANELRHLGHDGVPTGGTAATCVNDGCTTDGCAVSLTTVGQSITSCPHPPMTRCVWSVT